MAGSPFRIRSSKLDLMLSTGGLTPKTRKFEARFDAIDRRFDKLEQRFMQKLNSLTNTLDHFLKRITDMEEEFTFMKHDVNRIKAVLREKLGVAID
jgi:hypothetical protein